ncbi:preprotein translocase subunit SecD/SecD/SecF fusion protein [Dongia mobilis]|uniref:Protein translocase subunit SecD n=1 Tax=Dongia mobilis TaxID=578943 RepID=A0A4R6WNQ2_9PROT|nr:protein translocase subunit SecD [Dongia mobilis]TDQ80590.1 preprotein translocase subunit SecD/SecD/SecF fusion protein [Dongia mobilis]
MLQFSKFKVTLILLTLIIGIYAVMPNFFSEGQLQRLPSWLPARAVSLGLDLQGGSHLLFEVDTNALVKERLEGTVNEVRAALRGAGLGYTGLGLDGEQVIVRISDATAIERAREALAPLASGMELDIAPDGAVRLGFTEAAITQARTHAVDQSIEIIRRRIDETGTKEPTIIRQGEDRIVVQLPGVKDPQNLKALIGATAKMTFQMVDETAEATGTGSPTSIQLPMADGEGAPGQRLWVQRAVLVSGENLTDAQQTFDQGLPVVQFNFDSVGARKFGDATARNVGKRFAIVLDGKIISAPVIRDAILGGRGVISGNFTTQSAGNLALLLRAGALPAPLTVLEERTVGADLGADSIEAGKQAFMIAIVMVVVAMVVLYGFFGLVANVALVFNAVLLLGILSLLQATLTLPGIAGIVLTLGMAVDANVLILERVREEVRNGRSPVNAMEAGYREAQATIMDSNLTTLISTLFLFGFGSGPIKGFAVTLSVGIVTSVFTAVVVTRLITSIWLRRARPKVLPL